MSYIRRLKNIEDGISRLVMQIGYKRPSEIDLTRAKENLARLLRGEEQIPYDRSEEDDLFDERFPGPWKEILAEKLEAQATAWNSFANEDSHKRGHDGTIERSDNND